VRRGLSLAVLVVLATATGCGGGTSTTPTTVATVAPPKVDRPNATPFGFMGIVSEDVFAAGPQDRDDILAGQKRTGVELLRQKFDWSQIEKRRGDDDFSHYDGYLAATARHGIDVLPVLFGVPEIAQSRPVDGAHITDTTTMPPRSPAAFAAFARRVVERYGPGGAFWKAHPELPARPIRAWQVWNEPNLPVYWGGRVDAHEYVALLRATSEAIHAVDPQADVVTAGITQSRLGIPLETYLRALYRAGAKDTFDTLALHPYSTGYDGVESAVKLARDIADDHGDEDAGLWVTEVGWASGGPPSVFTVGPKRQAELVLQVFTQLGQQADALRLRGVVYYDWRDAPPYPGGKDFWGLHTGLLKRNGDGKPALSTYYQAAGVIARAR